jgi:hypothetical protein
MEKHSFKITIKGDKESASKKAKAIATLTSHLSEETLTALAKVVKTDPEKVKLAKQFLGV